jgi:hypothetical protein
MIKILKLISVESIYYYYMSNRGTSTIQKEITNSTNIEIFNKYIKNHKYIIDKLQKYIKNYNDYINWKIQYDHDNIYAIQNNNKYCDICQLYINNAEEFDSHKDTYKHIINKYKSLKHKFNTLEKQYNITNGLLTNKTTRNKQISNELEDLKIQNYIISNELEDLKIQNNIISNELEDLKIQNYHITRELNNFKKTV